VPRARAQGGQAQLLCHIRRLHCLGQILLVGENEQDGLSELGLVEHAVQLLASVLGALAVVAVHDEDQALRVLVVVAPEGTNLILSTDVPHSKADVLVLDRLDVKACVRGAERRVSNPRSAHGGARMQRRPLTNCGDGRDNLAELQLVQNRRLTSGCTARGVAA
jgi:hypothetical protein